MSTGTDSASGLPEWFPREIASSLPGIVEEEAAESEAREERLVRLAREGSHEAFRELVEMHRDRLFRFCVAWARDAEDAEEICQDTFVRAFRALPRYRHRARFIAWLFRIAVNLTRDRARSRHGRLAARSLSLDAGGEDPPLICRRARPDESCENEDRLDALRRDLERLPHRLREVLLLCAVEGLSHEECADLLGCSTRAVEGRLYRARRRLVRWSEERDEDRKN